jgi:DNA polymerase-3 subunit delta'
VSFPRVQGQQRAARLLSGLIEADRIPSALVFSGLDGVGKAMMAKEFAKALLCARKKAPTEPCQDCADCAAVEKGLHPDVKIVDAAYQASLNEGETAKQRILHAETLRHLRRDMEMHSMLGRWKVAIVCDAHTMTEAAANVLLKSLEEPQPKTLWILVTAQRGRMLKTILSRCFLVPFAPLTAEAVAAILQGRGLDTALAARLSNLCDGSASRAGELAETPEYPDSLRAGPLAAVEAAEGLPKELHLSRVQAERALFVLSQDLRLKMLDGRLSFHAVEKPLRELGRLRQTLRSNADPRTVLLLAALETEGL